MKTPELKRFSVQSLRVDEFLEQEGDSAEQTAVERNFQQRCEFFRSALDDLRSQAETMDDTEFDIAYSRLQSQINEFLDESFENPSLKKYFYSTLFSRAQLGRRGDMFTVKSFTDIREVHSLVEFQKNRVMWMEPRKEDIARIVGIAFDLHQERVRRGEVASDDPISIVDIGGGNAALGALCVQVAKESHLNIRYTVVDPDKRVMQPAQNVYGSEIEFEIKTSHEYLLSILGQEGNTEIVRTIKELDVYIDSMEKKYKNFLLLEKGLKNDRELESFDKVKENLFVVLKNDFFYVPDVKEQNDLRTWSDLFAIVDTIKKQWLERQHKIIAMKRQEIEQGLLGRKRSTDLVINSWMPGKMDITPDIRMIGGAGILYMSSVDGTTGIQDRRFFEDKDMIYRYPQTESYPDPTPGQEYSYGPGGSYNFNSGWVGPACSDKPISFYKKDFISGTFEFDMESRPLVNNFVFQLAKGYQGPSREAIQKHSGVDVVGEFPWEKDMERCSRLVAKPILFPEEEKDYTVIRKLLQLYGEQIEKGYST